MGFGGLGQAQQADRAQFVTSGDALSPATLSLLEGHTVAVEPVENSIVYTYPQLDWDPEPVLQAYSAYTSYLDRLDAAFLASVRAPERILFQPWMVIDGRDTFLDPPATVESLYCHYVQLPAPGPAQVLKRVANRCGQPVEVERVSAHFGSSITVPSRQGEMVTAAFSFGAPLGARLEGVLLKPPTVSLTTWIGDGRPLTYRFIPGTAADSHVLSAPPSLGYSADFTPAPVQRVALSGGGWNAGEGRYTVTFYAVPLGGP